MRRYGSTDPCNAARASDADMLSPATVAATSRPCSMSTTDARRRSLRPSAGGLRLSDARVPTSVSSRPRSSRATSRPLAGRASGSLASMRATSASTSDGTAASSPRGGASSSSTFASTAAMLSPQNAGCPAMHSKSTPPRAKTSARASSRRSPRACSGAMYTGVPIT